MNLYITNGIVFRNLKYSESSLIVDIYTLEKGLRSYMVSGSRSKNSQKKALFFQLFNQIQIVAYDGKEEKLCHIKEVHPSHHYKSLHSDIFKTSIGIFMIEIARNTIREKESNEELFQFLINRFNLLDEWQGKVSDFHLKFMLDLSSFLGFYPQLPESNDQIYFDIKEGAFVSDHHTNEFRLDEVPSKDFYNLMKSDVAGLHELNTSNKTRQIILDGLIKYYHHHIEGFRPIKSLDVLRTILS